MYKEFEELNKRLDDIEEALNNPLTKALNFVTGVLVIILLIATIYTAIVGNIGGAIVLGALFLVVHLARFTIAVIVGVIIGSMKELAKK